MATLAQPAAGTPRLWPSWLTGAQARTTAIEALSMAVGLALWEVLGHGLQLSWLPPVSSVAAALIEFVRTGQILGNLAASITALALGLTVSLVLGLSLGALMALYRRVDLALDVYVHALLVSPNIIFAPIFFALFGLSRITQVAVIVMFTVFVIIINTRAAFRGVDPALVEMAISFGASPRAVFWKIQTPAALPIVFAGIRLGMGRAVKGMLNGEMYIAVLGLGALVEQYGAAFDASNVLALSAVVVAVGLVGNGLVQFLDARLTSWAD
jgi:NitT/TauT family transport system permease protein